MIRAAMYGKGRSNLVTALRERKAFTTSGALNGEEWNRDTVTMWDLGRMDRDAANTFMIDHMAGIAYVVWSYGTPIGWVLKDGTVRIPSARYSVTTSRHQGMLYLLGE